MKDYHEKSMKLLTRIKDDLVIGRLSYRGIASTGELIRELSEFIRENLNNPEDDPSR